MRRLRSAPGWLFMLLALCALSFSPAHATPSFNNVEVLASRDGDGTTAGTERTWFIFRAVIAPADGSVLVGPPEVWVDVNNPGSPHQGGRSMAVNMVRDVSNPFRRDAWIAFIRGGSMPNNQTTGIGVPQTHNWAIIAADASPGNAAQVGSNGAAQNLVVHPSLADARFSPPRPSVIIVPVAPDGSNDKAPGPGQQGNGLRVDPQDPTSPNDGGSSHFYTWRCRVTTVSGLPAAFFRNDFEWNFYQSSVVLVLHGPDGQPHYCPMEIDPSVGGQSGLQDQTYTAGPKEGVRLPLGAAIWRDTGIIYRYRMLPTQYNFTQFGGGANGAGTPFSRPDGLFSNPLGGRLPDSEYPILGRPHANEYAAFAGLDPLLLSLFGPPPWPVYTDIGPTGFTGMLRAGQWNYYYAATVDFRPDLTNSQDQNSSFWVNGWPNGPVTDYRDRYGDPTRYRLLADTDDPMGYPGSTAFPYQHPFVTPILSDGGWTDDLAENQFLQPDEPGINVTYDGVSQNARRSRVTTKTKVRFQCRVARAITDTGPILVRVFITDANNVMKPYTMQPRTDIPGNTNYQNGVIYFYDATFPVGEEGRHSMYFEADDGQHKAIWPRRPDDDPQGAGLPVRGDAVNFGTLTVGRNYQLEPWVNNRATLTNPAVTPKSGVEKQAYTYEVTYTDRDNDDPIDGWVVVDGTPYRMTPIDPNVQPNAGRRYRVVVTELPTIIGKHNYYFKFRDNWAPYGRPIRREFGEWVTLPQGDDQGNPSTVLEGPTIIGNNAPELVEPNFYFTDPAQTPATLYDFVIRYKDADNDAPGNIKLFISADGGLSWDAGTSLVKAESSDNYQTGVQYHLPARIRLPQGNNYRYRFVASDGKVDTTVVHMASGAFAIADGSARILKEVSGGTVYADPQGTFKWQPTGLLVWKGAGTTATLLTLGTDYTLDADNGRITLAVPNTAGVPIRASYFYIETAGPTVAPNNAPTLTFPDEKAGPNYRTIDKTIGDPNTDFTWTVIYRDGDNQPPLADDGTTQNVIYVVLDSPNSGTGGTRVAMAPVGGPPYDWKTGVSFSATGKLATGTHHYHFEANDGAAVARRPGLNGSGDVDGNGKPLPQELPGPVVANVGTLQEPGEIIPFPKGKHDVLYSFTVTYKNPDGLAPPAPVHVQITPKGGTAATYVMTAIDPIGPNEYKNGVRFRTTFTGSANGSPLQPGNYDVTFGYLMRQTDGTDLFLGSTTPVELIVNGVPVLSRVGGNSDVAPNPVSQSQDITLTVRYQDVNGDAPTEIKAWVKGPGANDTFVALDPAVFALTTTPATPTAADFKNGVVYTWTGPAKSLPGGAIGTYAYHFTAKDDMEAATTFPAPDGTFAVKAAGALELLNPTADAATNFGTLTPLIGPKSGTYTYRVYYRHADGILPNRLQLLIDQGGATPKTINLTVSTPANPTPDQIKGLDPASPKGVLYTYTTAPNELDVTPPAHTYRFEAEDRFSSVILRNGTADFTGPTINNPPILTAGTVFREGDTTVPTVDGSNALTPPLTGTIRDKFIFRVSYKDLDNVQPDAAKGFVKVVVKDAGGATTEYPLTAKTNPPVWNADVVFETAPLALTPGVKTFHFEANDGLDLTRFPGTADITGLSVKNIALLIKPGAGAANDGTLIPLTGAQQGQYLFKVRYQHPDNTPPASPGVQVLVDEGTANAQIFVLTPTAGQPTPLDYTAANGVEFTYTTLPGELSSGQHTYRFKASDGIFTAALPEDGSTYTGPTVNFPPTLTNPTAFVEGATTVPTVTGDTLTPAITASTLKKVVFRVTYTDQDGNAPEGAAENYIRVSVSDETPIVLVKKAGDPGDIKAGVVYESAPTLLKPGQKTFHFEAKDGQDTARVPAGTTEISGLTVANVPTLTGVNATGDDGTVSPHTGPLSTTFTYQVVYKHPDNSAPTSVKLYIDDTAFDMTKVGTSSNYAAGVTYQYQYRFPANTTSSHTYRFEAVDSISPDYIAKYPADGSKTTGPTVNIASFDTPVFSPSPGTINNKVTLTGKMTPAQAASITLQLVRPDGTGVNETVSVAADGTFTHQFTPNQTGDWKVRLSWVGKTGEFDPVTQEFPFRVTGFTLPVPAGKLDMIASPLIPATPDPTISFGPTKADGTTPLDISKLNVIKWMPNGVNGRYLYLNNDANFPGILPGHGYWVRPSEAAVLNPRGRLADQTQTYSIPLAEGWNMIGSVYLQDINWSAVKVRVNGQLVSLTDSASLVRPVAWGYNPSTGGYEMVSGGGVLKTGRGYWVRALQSCELVLPAPGTRAGDGGRDVVERDDSLRIVARAGDRADVDNYAPLTASGKSRLALMEKPPYVGDYVTVRFLSPESVQLPADTRAATVGQNVVVFEVETDHKNADVTVQFPNASALGRRYDVTVVDLASNTRRSVANASGITYNTGENTAARRFALVIGEARRGDHLLITDLQSSGGRATGVTTFTYNVSGAASVRAQVVGAGGQVVRTLTQGRAVTRGVNSLLWDGKDNRGVSVPTGAYILRLTATDDRGRATTAVLPVTLVR